MQREAFERMSKRAITPGAQRAMGGGQPATEKREDFLLSTRQSGGLDTLVPAAKGHIHTHRMKASMLSGSQHFTPTLGPFVLQGQRSSLEAWLARLEGRASVYPPHSGDKDPTRGWRVRGYGQNPSLCT